jgi:multidrug transporter EmrE-like cation transporter
VINEISEESTMNTPAGIPHPENTSASISSIIMTAIEGFGIALLSLSIYAIPMAIAYFLFHAITG